MASKKQIIAPRTRTAPPMSIRASFSFQVALAGLTCEGVLKKKVMMAKEMPPMGRLTTGHVTGSSKPSIDDKMKPARQTRWEPSFDEATTPGLQ